MQPAPSFVFDANTVPAGTLDVYISTRPIWPADGTTYAPDAQAGSPMSHCQPVRFSVWATPSIVVAYGAVLPYELWALKLFVVTGDQLPMMSTMSPLTIGMLTPIDAVALPTLCSAVAPLMRTRK